MWSIVVHGGAGAIHAAQSAPHQAACRRAIEVGAARLESGGSALDAVCAAVRVLEDDPVLNAGIGGALDARGWVRHDAAVMRGSDLAYGAVASVGGVRNPIDLARAVLEDGRHCLLSGAGAVELARARGVALQDPARAVTDPSLSRWWFAKAEVSDTVGAVARDADGRLAAATSTGGILGKLAGRIGDSPIAGAGLYARDDLGAISATGHGETILRTVLGYEALRGLAESADPEAHLAAALEAAFQRARGRAGLIAVRPDGRIAFSRNTDHMSVAWASSGRAVESAF
jgi:beta-aspartyl-peptidase (threonine type)